jgi:glycosyltransferase involved in cell wall biosynthesis
MNKNARRLAIFVSFSGAGGVERNILNLLPEFLKAGVAVDVLVVFRKPAPELLRLEGSGLRILDLGVKHTGLAVPALVNYLKCERPAALLAAKDRAIRAAALARRLCRADVPLIGQLNTHLSASLESKPAPARWLRTRPMRWIYPLVDKVIAVSEGVADDTRRLTGLPGDRVPVIRNPVITPDMAPKGAVLPAHPWFKADAAPVALGVGRLTVQKDFETLLRAFAKVRAARPCRLMILGEGRGRSGLERLAAELGLGGDFELPGHVENPYAYMSKAALFVLSSRWEGSGNVLTEAMALGTPVVSTDCPSGPREMLADGRYGPLVPVGDPGRLAEAMLHALGHPTDPALLREAVAEYTAERSARRYLEVLGLA